MGGARKLDVAIGSLLAAGWPCFEISGLLGMKRREVVAIARGLLGKEKSEAERVYERDAGGRFKDGNCGGPGRPKKGVRLPRPSLFRADGSMNPEAFEDLVVDGEDEIDLAFKTWRDAV